MEYSTKMKFSHKLSAFVTAINLLLLIAFDSLFECSLFMQFAFLSAMPFISWLAHVFLGGYPVKDV